MEIRYLEDPNLTRSPQMKGLVPVSLNTLYSVSLACKEAISFFPYYANPYKDPVTVVFEISNSPNRASSCHVYNLEEKSSASMERKSVQR